MRIGRKRWSETRREIQRRDKEPATRPIAPSGRPFVEVRCHRCRKLLAYAERANQDYIVLPPQMAPAIPLHPEPVMSLPEAPDVRVIPAGAGIIALWCPRCREQSYTHSPQRIGRENGKPK